MSEAAHTRKKGPCNQGGKGKQIRREIRTATISNHVYALKDMAADCDDCDVSVCASRSVSTTRQRWMLEKQCKLGGKKPTVCGIRLENRKQNSLNYLEETSQLVNYVVCMHALKV